MTLPESQPSSKLTKPYKRGAGYDSGVKEILS